MTQSEYGNRGSLRLLETLQPDRVIVLRGRRTLARIRAAPIGQLGTGPIVRDGGVNLPEKWKALPARTAHVPVLFAQTPVETVDARDVDALAAWSPAWASRRSGRRSKHRRMRTLECDGCAGC